MFNNIEFSVSCSSIDCLDDESAIHNDEVHVKESEVKNDSGNCSVNMQDKNVSNRTADIVPERSRLVGEEPVRKKGRRSKGQDTQKSSAIRVVTKSRVFRNSAARNVKGETQLHVACRKVGFIVL
jgi:hypothetical protein